MRLKRSAEDIIAIGQELIDAKEQLAHGQFGAWLTAEFEMSQDTAENFINVAVKFGDQFRNYRNMPVSVLYLLAKPRTPDAVIERVTSGEVAPTVSEVKRAIAEAKAAQAAQFVWSVNAERRQLTASQRAMAAQALMPELEAEAKARQRRSGQDFGRGKVDGKSDQPISDYPDPYTDIVKPHDHRNPRAADYAAKLAGVDATTVYKAKQLVERAKTEPQAVAQVAREGERVSEP